MRPETYAAAERLAAALHDCPLPTPLREPASDVVDAFLVEAADELFPVVAWTGHREVMQPASLEFGGVCTVEQPTGWRCTRNYHVSGPCAGVPRWWNAPAWVWLWRLRLGWPW